MAATGDRNDPILAFRFEVQIDELAAGGGFTECTGLRLETAVHDYAEGGLNSFGRKFPTRTSHSNITLKRGIVDRVLWDWYFDLVNGRVRQLGGSIVVRSPDGGSPVAVWHFRRGFPCKWIGPDLNASQNSVAVETLEICHHGFERHT